MPHNFVMLFHGKEGSSSYMSHLKNHPGIEVPMFEGLDWYLVKEKHDVNARLGQMHLAAEKVLATGKYNLETLFDDTPLPSLEESGLAGTSVGFKWRIWGDLDLLADVFRRQRVILLNIQRRSFSNLIFSDYVTSVETRKLPELEHLGSSHFQFIIASASEAEKQKIWRKLKAIRFDIEPDSLWKIAQGFLANYQERTGIIEALSAKGVPVHNIFYEDFVDDPEKSLTDTLHVLGHEFHPDVMTTEFQKVLQTNPLDMANNSQEVLKMPAFLEFEAEWNSLRDRILACSDRAG
ncbi:hypothetical protein ACTL6U_05695 [Rhodovibrionaceae bacterium A322]